MIPPETKLKKVSDSVFQQLDEDHTSRRPLEWRRDFNLVSFRICDTQIRHAISLDPNSLEAREDEDQVRLSNRFASSLQESLTLTGFVDEDSFRDTLLVAETQEDSEDIYTLRRPNGKIIVTLRASQGSNKKLPDESATLFFTGHAFALNYEPGEDDLHFDLEANGDQLEKLIKRITGEKCAILEVAIRLNCFSFEVDDALREPYHPRDLFIEDVQHCFIQSIAAISRLDNENEDAEAKPRDDWEEEQETNEIGAIESAKLAELQAQYNQLAAVLASHASSLRSLSLGLWILVLVAITSLFVN